MRIRNLCAARNNFVAWVILALLLPIGCAAQNSKRERVKKSPKVEIVDSVARKILSDSVFSVLTEGKIKAMLVSHDGNGVKYSEAKWLSREDCQLLRFLITDPVLYQGTTPVYGRFTPCIAFEFQKSKGESVTVSLDFGLREWAITDSKGKEFYKSSLSSNSLLRFSYFLYPENGFIKNLYYSNPK